ncbi:nudix-type nucleoside diphosphatase (YffH/AdpP family) [Pseudochelatococcus lubricantis]|uniref:GDP-mannose pyrophosphatase n=1 Tax=Pseudochelatococcus lubricantis TaxID=1538102 RepID=A0ABX0UVI2_9HYPH|nr:NUDIX hydrolase [Pseudochelatococcus lubricantis]NIJ56772.1 nudix-type nucleoside diphosphatase (YffH/AdpP family) [Pseudochelatococcus lubricantis]
MAFEITDTKIVHEGWGRFMIATIRLPDGQIIRREIEDHGAAVAVLAYDPERRVALMVSQFRPPVHLVSGDTALLEIIAGGLEDDETREACVRREAMEEGGLRLGALDHVVDAWPMPGISTERIALYLAPYAQADRVAAGGGLAEENEGITVVELPLTQLAALADSGALSDLKSYATVQALRLRRPELFA